MDNPQHYQPLSHALNPPLAAKSQPKSSQNYSSIYDPGGGHREEEEEEEDDEDEDDEDEGIVEDQLHDNDSANVRRGTNLNLSTREDRSATGTTNQNARSTAHSINIKPSEHDPDYSPRKRRPGRPRGSKNRRPRSSVGDNSIKPLFYAYNPAQAQSTPQPAASTAATSTSTTSSAHAPATTTSATTTATPTMNIPQNPDVNAQNQQYYEFQWRVLNLCAEFYGAAEELVKATPPLVLAQCYHVGPSSKVDPITMLGDAKRICDTLLANPSRLITSPPPPLYHTMPTFGQSSSSTPPVAPSSAPKPSTSNTPPSSNHATATTVITNPQSFIVPLSSQQVPAVYPPAQYTAVYQPPPQYSTAAYYPYPGYAHPGPTYYPQTHPQAQPPPPSAAQKPQTPGSTLVSLGSGPVPPGINQGSWSDEETERLKKLAEQSKGVGSSGDIEWDWVVHQWGNGRTRHQILIKATSLGLKESSSRGIKRRRDTDTGQVETESPTPAPLAHPTSVAPSTVLPPMSSSPTLSHTTSPPTASPMSNQQPQRLPPMSKIPSSTTPAPTTAVNLPWPMPTVAANTPSPVVAASSVGGGGGGQAESQRTSYYRGLPDKDILNSSSSSSSSPKTAHSNIGRRGTGGYMYQANGNSGSRLGKENGR